MSKPEAKTVSFRRGPVRGAFERPTQPAGAILKRIAKYLHPHWAGLAAAAVLSILGNLVALVGPRLSGRAIDAISSRNGVDFPNVFRYAFLMIGCYLISGAMSYTLSVLMIRISRKAVYAMRKDAFEKLVSLPVSFHDSHQPGDVISRISYDIDTINSSLTHDLVLMVSSMIVVIGSFTMMLSISPVLVLIFVVTIPASALITRYRAKKVRPLYRERSVPSM